MAEGRITRNLEVLGDQLSQMLNGWIQDVFKALNISMPAMVLSFNPKTKRAVVQPGLRSIFKMPSGNRSLSRPPLSDVPILFPSAGGYVHYFPIRKGDIVQLYWNHRGLENFKKTWKESDPDDVLSSKDVVAYAGWGSMTISPRASESMCIQKEDGTASIRIAPNGDIDVETDGNIKAKADGNIVADAQGKVSASSPSSASLTAPVINLNGNVFIGGFLAVRGKQGVPGNASFNGSIDATGDVVGSGISLVTHRHSDPQGGQTGPPS